jgi:hypothetical protein
MRKQEEAKQGPPEAEDIMFEPREIGTLPWFKFWPHRWIGSATVQRMSMSARGLYITMMAYQWVLGSLPRDPWQLGKLLGVDCRTTVRWLELYSDLTVNVQSSSSHFTLPKLEELAVLLRKSTPESAGEENRYKNKKRIDSYSASRKRKKDKPSGIGLDSKPQRIPGLTDQEYDRFIQGYGREDCSRCQGRGNYFLDDPMVTPVPRIDRCDCIPEPYR